MGFVIVGGGKIRLVGGNQRKTLGIGQIDQRGFDPPFLVDAVALQFDIEPVAEQRGQPVAARRRQRGMVAMKGERAMITELVRRIEAGKIPLSAIIGGE